MRPAALVVGFCWLIPAPLISQDRTPPRIQGLVVDSVTGSAIPQAVVLIEGHGQTWTDRSGWYALQQVPDGEYLVAAVTRDCRIATVRVRLTDNEPVRLDLNVGLYRMEGADAVRTRERAEGSGLKVTTRDEIQKMKARSVPEILRQIAPSMVGGPTAKPGSTLRATERGRTTLTRPRAPLLLLDGVRVADMQAFESIDPTTVIRVEIGGGAIAGWEHGLDGASGVIHVYTVNERPVENPWCGAAPPRS
jgi:hypothetical protein